MSEYREITQRIDLKNVAKNPEEEPSIEGSTLEKLSPKEEKILQFFEQENDIGVIYDAIEKGEITKEDFLSPAVQEVAARKVKGKLLEGDILSAAYFANVVSLDPETRLRRDFQLATKEGVLERLENGDLGNLGSVLRSLPIDTEELKDKETQELVATRLRQYLKDRTQTYEVMILTEFFPIPSEVLRELGNVLRATEQMEYLCSTGHINEAKQYEKLLQLEEKDVETAIMRSLESLARGGAVDKIQAVLDEWPVAQQLLHIAKTKKFDLEGVDRILRMVGIFGIESLEKMIALFNISKEDLQDSSRKKKATLCVELIKDKIEECVEEEKKYSTSDTPDNIRMRESWIEAKKRHEMTINKINELFGL